MIKDISLSQIPHVLQNICEVVGQVGGRVWLVGGCVRDLVLGDEPKDWDVEVYGLEPSVLIKKLEGIGHCEWVGKHFGVIKLWVKGLEVDVALPRTEKKDGCGHSGFTVSADIHLKPEKAVLRRDFTMNAMMFDPLQNVFLDFHNGLEDLQNKRLRHVSPAFVEDPLRPLRAMQFAARFQLSLAEETMDLCRQLLPEYTSLPESRVWQEWLKWAGSEYPLNGLQVLKDMGWISLYPQLEMLMGCPQDKKWHPEGDVWVHTCLVVNEAARLAYQRQLGAFEQATLVFAALCHDFGKPLVTEVDKNGRVLAPEHGLAGVEPALVFLKNIGMQKKIRNQVAALVQEHVTHFSEELTARGVRWLAYRLEPANIILWEMLTEADAGGCPPLSPCRPAKAWLEQAERLCITKEKELNIVTGKLLIALGMSPSVSMGEVLESAYQAQMNGEFSSEASACSWLKKYHIATDEN